MTQNLYEFYSSAFLLDPDRIFLRAPDGTACSYSDADQISGRMSNVLIEGDARPGDRVVVCADKSPHVIFLYFACLRAGLVFVPVHPGLPPSGLLDIIGTMEPKIVICSPGNERMLRENAQGPLEARIFTLDSTGAGSLTQLCASRSPSFSTPILGGAAPAVCVHTSGTSGRSKAVVLTHRSLMARAKIQHGLWGWSPDDVLIHALPLYHFHGLFLALNGILLSAAATIFLPRFDAAEVIRLMPEATAFTGVPTLYNRLLAEPALDRRTCRDMRLFLSSSAGLSPSTFRDFHERTGHDILECYGATEIGTIATNPVNGERRPGTVGPPVPGIELRIADRDGQPVPPGDIGVLEVRSPHAFLGYWRNRADTERAFRADGYYITNDLAAADDDGYIRIVGHAGDLIVTGGEKVYPSEVEAAINHIPGVQSSAVFGLDHHDFGQIVVAVIVRMPGDMHVSSAGIDKALREKLVGYKIPRKIIFSDALPVNHIGKTQRHALRERYNSMVAGQPC